MEPSVVELLHLSLCGWGDAGPQLNNAIAQDDSDIEAKSPNLRLSIVKLSK
jgi:hypothetical protein